MAGTASVLAAGALAARQCWGVRPSCRSSSRSKPHNHGGGSRPGPPARRAPPGGRTLGTAAANDAFGARGRLRPALKARRGVLRGRHRRSGPRDRMSRFRARVRDRRSRALGRGVRHLWADRHQRRGGAALDIVQPLPELVVLLRVPICCKRPVLLRDQRPAAGGRRVGCARGHFPRTVARASSITDMDPWVVQGTLLNACPTSRAVGARVPLDSN